MNILLEDVSASEMVPVSELKPSPENKRLYHKNDSAIKDLAKRIKAEGQLEDLVVTADNFIVSGHQRHAAMLLAGVTLARCKRLQKRRQDYTTDEYIKLIRSYNRQREKTADEKMREEIIDIDPDAVDGLYKQRSRLLDTPIHNDVEILQVEGSKRRYELSDDKADHIAYALKAIQERRKFWPLSDRGVHYALLNYRFIRGYYYPRRNDEDWGGPPRVLYYENDKKSYKMTTDLLTRLRLNGTLPWEALADPTRPVTEFKPFGNIRDFIQKERDSLFVGYWRNLLQSQPNHVEVLVEKNTVYHMVLQVTRKYQIPTRSARGVNCIDSFHDMADAFKKSGKRYLDLIVMSDHDPEGQFIPHDAGRRLRDCFGIEAVRVIPAGVTRGQIQKYNLPSDNEAKDTSPHYKWYVNRNGGDNTTWELEALDPQHMLADLDNIIRNVISIDLFNKEVTAEKEEMKTLAGLRNAVQKSLRNIAP